MKIGILKRTLTLTAAVSAFVLLAVPAGAAPLKRDLPKGYATGLPAKNSDGVLTFEDFETAKKDDEGRIGKFAATVPDDTKINPAKVEIVSDVAHSGKKSLKVSDRGTNAAGVPQGYNTLNYKDIGIDIGSIFKSDSANRNKTDTYFISAWVRNVDPNAVQYFWPQLQYGGSGEVWLPGQTYFKVTGKEWTQIGASVVDGKTYFLPFIEDSTKSGIYAPRSGVSTWSALKMITKNPKEDPSNKNEAVVQTNYDYYIDDIVIWKVEDASKLIAELPKPSDTASKPGASSKPAAGASSTAAVESTLESSDVISSEEAVSSEITSSESVSSKGEAATDSSKPQTEKEKSHIGIIAGIIAAVVVLGGGGFALYWFKFRK